MPAALQVLTRRVRRDPAVPIRRVVGCAIGDIGIELPPRLVVVDGLDLIPPEWLHMTMQGVGFVDEVAPEERRDFLKALRAGLAAVPPPVVTFHRPVVRPEAVYLPAEPAEPIHTVRADAQSGIVADRSLGVNGGRPWQSPEATLSLHMRL